MNPAFPTIVYIIPNCWRVLPVVSAIPQQIPPRSNLFFSVPVIFFFAFPRFKSAIHGISTIPPINVLTQLNVNGPTYSIPTLCATNAIPHMMAASNSNSDPFTCSFFIVFKPSLSLACWIYFTTAVFCMQAKRKNTLYDLIQITKAFLLFEFKNCIYI